MHCACDQKQKKLWHGDNVSHLKLKSHISCFNWWMSRDLYQLLPRAGTLFRYVELFSKMLHLELQAVTRISALTCKACSFSALYIYSDKNICHILLSMLTLRQWRKSCLIILYMFSDWICRHLLCWFLGRASSTNHWYLPLISNITPPPSRLPYNMNKHGKLEIFLLP